MGRRAALRRVSRWGLAVRYSAAAQRARATAQSVRRAVADPPRWPAGHFYSAVPSREDLRRADQARRPPVGVDLAEQRQLDLLAHLDLRLPATDRWRPDNVMFGASDAALLDGVLRGFRPGRVVEVGSGWSTALVLDTAEREGLAIQVTCVEPHAERLRSLLRDTDRVELIEALVQDLPPADLAARVGPGDVLFIDSTHVVKAGSDVNHLVLDTLPLLPVGALVHVHDIFWPFEYPGSWLDEGRHWNENYLLRAFLAHNHDWEILLFGSWLWTEHRDRVPEGLRDHEPGSLWLRRVR